MSGYQTKTQVLLDILLEEAEEDLALSQQRIDGLMREKDFESLEIEQETNKLFRRKKEAICFLIGLEENSHSNVRCLVQTGYLNDKGKVQLKQSYTSKSSLRTLLEKS